MAATPYGTAEKFLRRERGSNGAFVSTGSALYTYAKLIAYWTRDGEMVWVIDPKNPPRWSATSNRHIKAALFVLPTDARVEERN